jgi:hypothetical protein
MVAGCAGDADSKKGLLKMFPFPAVKADASGNLIGQVQLHHIVLS